MNVWMYVLIIVIIFLFLYVLIVYNKLVHLKVDVEEAFSTIDVYLKKRWDLVPNLVEVVKGYSKHEKDVFVEVTKLREKTYDELSMNNKIDLNIKLSPILNKIMLLKEAYPDLKANEQYLELSKNLVKIEDEIAKSRKYYNAVVRLYNNKVEMFPSCIIAFIFGYKKLKMFEAKEEEKENVKI